MDFLKRTLTKFGIEWKTAFDHANFISIYDKQDNIVGRVYKSDGKYYFRYFGKYIYGCSNYVFDSVYDLIDHVEVQMETVNKNNKTFEVLEASVHQQCGEPDYIDFKLRKAHGDGITFEYANKIKNAIEHLNINNDVRIDVSIPTPRNFKDTVEFYFAIKDVIFNDPATIVFWADGEKTVVKRQKGETFDPEKGLAMAIAKKIYGGTYDYYEVFAKYVGRYNKKRGKKNDT